MSTEFASLKMDIKNYYKLEDATAFDFCAAAYLANKLDTNPVWGFLIAPPSKLKTDFMELFYELPEAYPLSTLTPKTLVSGHIDESNPTKDFSLIHQLGGKILYLKDFTTVLSMRGEDRNIILSHLREAYDGDLAANFGNKRGRMTWKGKFGLLAGVTPAIDRHHAVMNQLGERFISYRLPLVDDDSDEAFNAISKIGKENKSRTDFSQRTKAIMQGLANGMAGKSIECSQENNRRIASLSALIVKARSHVERDRYRGNAIVEKPQPEGPARFAKSIAALAIGRAPLVGCNNVEETTMQFIEHVAWCSIPPARRAVLEVLKVKEAASVTEIVEEAGLPWATTNLILEDLEALKLVKKGGSDPLKVWTTSPMFKKLMDKWNSGNSPLGGHGA